jgi:hypothetical protein
MHTMNIEFVRHIYTLDVSLKTYDKYTISNRSEIGESKLSNIVRIEPFYGFSNAYDIDNCLRLQKCGKWAKKKATGLRPHCCQHVFYGDHLSFNKQSLLIFQFSENKRILIIDYFNSFYPRYATWRTNLLNNHNYFL